MLSLEEAHRMIRETDRLRSALITDPRLPDNPIVFVSAAFESHTGYSRAEALGRNPRFLQGPKTEVKAQRQFQKAIAEGIETMIDITNYRKDGTPFLHRVHLKPMLGPTREIENFVAIQYPVTPELII